MLNWNLKTSKLPEATTLVFHALYDKATAMLLAMLLATLLLLCCTCFTAFELSLPLGASSKIVDQDTLQLTQQQELRHHHSRRRYNGALKAYIQSELLLRQVVQECTKGENTVLQLSQPRDSVSVLQALKHLPEDAPCPALDIALRGSERGVGMCTDAALYVIHLGPVSHTGRGARIIPLLPEMAMKGYNARCTTTTARMLLESMYSEWFAPPAVGGYHIMQVNSEHLFKDHQKLHSSECQVSVLWNNGIDVFLCKTRFCQTLLWKYVSHHGWKSEVWFIGHTSSDVLVTTAMLNPRFLQTSSVAMLLSPARVTNTSLAGVGMAHPLTSSKRRHEGTSAGTGLLSNSSTISTSSATTPRNLELQHPVEPYKSYDEAAFSSSSSSNSGPTSSRTLGSHKRSPTAADIKNRQRPTFGRADRFSRFLHVKGKSGLKHTRQLLECWRSHPEFPLLTVVGQISAEESGMLKAAVRNVRVLPRPSTGGRKVVAATEAGSGPGMHLATGGQSSRSLAGLESQQMLRFEDIRQMQANMGVQVCASEREGFGHYLNEARAAGAVVISTDHPPMNEMVRDGVDGVLVKPATTGSYSDLQALAPYGSINAFLSPTDICNAVQRVLGLSLHERQQLGQRARAGYLKDKSSFVRKVRVLRKVLHRRHMEGKFSTPR